MGSARWVGVLCPVFGCNGGHVHVVLSGQQPHEPRLPPRSRFFSQPPLSPEHRRVPALHLIPTARSHGKQQSPAAPSSFGQTAPAPSPFGFGAPAAAAPAASPFGAPAAAPAASPFGAPSAAAPAASPFGTPAAGVQSSPFGPGAGAPGASPFAPAPAGRGDPGVLRAWMQEVYSKFKPENVPKIDRLLVKYA